MSVKPNKPKILVTGGAGYIGSHTVTKLIDVGYDVVVVDNLSTGFCDAVDFRAVFIEEDVRNTASLITILKRHKIDAVIHFAAKLLILESIENPDLYYSHNVDGMTSLIKACQSAQVLKIVFSSSSAVYGNTSPSASLSESGSTIPLNPYGNSKMISEQLLQTADAALSIKSIILRYFNVAGAHPRLENGPRNFNTTHLLRVVSQNACGIRKNIEIFGNDYPTKDGTAIRDYIHVDDLADINVLSLQYLLKENRSEIFNCGYELGYSVKEIITTMEKLTGRKLNYTFAPRRPGDPGHLVANCEKLKQILKWQPKWNNINDLCRSALNWEMKLANSLK